MKETALTVFIKEMETRLATFKAQRPQTRFFSAERKRLSGKIKELESLIWIAHKHRRTLEVDQLEQAYLKGCSDQFNFNRSGKMLNFVESTMDAIEWRIKTYGK